MTTYNSYAEAKIAMPLACIIHDTDNARFFGMPSREGTTLTNDGCKFAEPQDYCMTVERFLAGGHKFELGDICLDDEGCVINIDVEDHTWNKPDNLDVDRFILRAAALEEKPFLQTSEEFEHTKTLNFIYERLIEVHGENPNFDYMHKLKNAIAMVEDRESPCNQAALNKPKRVKVSYVSADFSKEWKAVRYYNEVGELFVVDFNGNYSNVNDISGTWYEVICKNYDSLFIQIETEIDERQEFIDAAIGVLNVHYQNAAATLCGDLFDSGKFKLVNAD